MINGSLDGKDPKKLNTDPGKAVIREYTIEFSIGFEDSDITKE